MTVENKFPPILFSVPGKERLTKLPPFYTRDEVTALLGACHNYRDRLIVNMLWQLGPHVSELLSVRVEDLDFDKMTVKIQNFRSHNGRGDGTKKPYRVLPLKQHLALEIDYYIKRCRLQSEDCLFNLHRSTVNRILDRLAKEAGVDRNKAFPITLRHSFGIHCTLSGVPLKVLQEWMGHASITNTSLYSRALNHDSKEYYETLKF